MSYAQKLQQEGILTNVREIAKNMLFGLNLDINVVQQATKLPKAELEKILHDNNK